MSLSNLEIVRRYLAAVEQQAQGDELAAFFSPDVVQEELPNRLTPHGMRRGLTELLAAAVSGRKALSAQTYEIVSAIESGNTVALEALWTGTLAVPLGTLPVGATMRARLAMFIELSDGKIVRQRNYDCFEPW